MKDLTAEQVAEARAAIEDIAAELRNTVGELLETALESESREDLIAAQVAMELVRYKAQNLCSRLGIDWDELGTESFDQQLRALVGLVEGNVRIGRK